MKSNQNDRAGRILLTGTLFTAYIFLLVGVFASAFDTSLYHFLLG